MLILFCDNSLKELINFRGEVINHFIREGHEVILVAPNNYSGEIPCKFIDVNISRSGMNPLVELKYFRTLLNIYKKERPDIIFHYTIKPNIYGSIASRICKIKSVAMVTGLGYVFNHNDLKSKIARWLYKTGLKFSHKIITLNQHNFDTLLNHKITSREKLLLLPGGEGINTTLYS